jgi:hypothetical protein
MFHVKHRERPKKAARSFVSVIFGSPGFTLFDGRV